MVNFLLKLMLCPGVIFLADVFSTQINYANAWQIIYTGVIAGIAGYIMDVLLLKRISSELTAVMDTIAAFLVVYFSQFILPSSYITMGGAFIAALLLGLSEYLTHRLIVSNPRMLKRHGV